MPQKPLTPQQTIYREKQEAMKALQKSVDAAARKAAKEWKANNPDISADLEIWPTNRAYIKGQGKTKAILKMVEIMLWASSESKTQADITREANAFYPDIRLHDSLWQRELNQSLLKKIQGKIDRNMARPLSIKGCKKLSEIRKKLKAQQATSAAEKRFKTDIKVSQNSVVVGDTIHPIELRKYGMYTYPSIRISTGGKRQWLRVDILVQLLS